jgi:hypothetical protein
VFVSLPFSEVRMYDTGSFGRSDLVQGGEGLPTTHGSGPFGLARNLKEDLDQPSPHWFLVWKGLTTNDSLKKTKNLCREPLL